MSILLTAYKSTVGKKIIMALSGLVLVGFVVGHMAGNLKVFGGITPDGLHKIDAYGIFLREMGSDVLGHSGFLWLVRVVLVVAVILHAWSGITLSALNRSARPVQYKVTNYASSNAASRTMAYGGILLALFIVMHILHLTTGSIRFGSFTEGAVFSNLASGFSLWYVAAIYIVAMAALALHLYHGTWSMFQTLGVDHPRWNGGLRTIAKVVAIAIFFGFSAVPVGFLSGVLHL